MNTFDLSKQIKIINPCADNNALYGPWESKDIALQNIPEALRTQGLTFGIIENKTVVEYWWPTEETFYTKNNCKKKGGAGGNLILNWKNNRTITRNTVEISSRKPGLQVSYLDKTDINNPDWRIEQFINSDINQNITDEIWGKEENWKKIIVDPKDLNNTSIFTNLNSTETIPEDIYATKTELNNKQDKLVSGVNIKKISDKNIEKSLLITDLSDKDIKFKTINNESIFVTDLNNLNISVGDIKIKPYTTGIDTSADVFTLDITTATSIDFINIDQWKDKVVTLVVNANQVGEESIQVDLLLPQKAPGYNVIGDKDPIALLKGESAEINFLIIKGKQIRILVEQFANPTAAAVVNEGGI